MSLISLASLDASRLPLDRLFVVVGETDVETTAESARIGHRPAGAFGYEPEAKKALVGTTSSCLNSLRKEQSRSGALFGGGKRGSATSGRWVVRLLQMHFGVGATVPIQGLREEPRR